MNKYEVLGVVGEGAYGVVLKCKNRETNEVVAIKKFKESDDDELAKKSTMREVRFLRMLKHENVVLLKEAFRRKGKLYLVFEYVERNLLEVLEKTPSGLDPEDIRKFIFQLCQGIEFCHANEILHRDIKPENLLISKDGCMKLCDFGFARLIPQKMSDKLTDYVATRWYRSPELLVSSHNYGKPVDIWAIGCILGELTDGQPLFPGDTEFDQLHMIQKVLGPITTQQMELFQKTKRYAGLTFAEGKRQTLEEKYLGKLPRKALAFMKACLKMDPNERITAAAALQHPYFEGLVPIPHPTVGLSHREADLDNSIVGSSGTKAPSTQTTIIHSNGNPMHSLQKSTIFTDMTSLERKSLIGRITENVSRQQKNNTNNNVQGIDAQDNMGSGRSASMGKAALKFEKLHMAYNSNLSKKDIFNQPHHAAAQPSHFGKKMKGENKEEIEGNLNIPDLFMKTRFGSLSQYNYDIKGPGGELLSKEKLSPQKPHASPETIYKRQNPLSIPLKMTKRFANEPTLFQEPLNSREGRGGSQGPVAGHGAKKSEGEASKLKPRIPPIMSNMKAEYSLEAGKPNTLRQTKGKLARGPRGTAPIYNEVIDQDPRRPTMPHIASSELIDPPHPQQLQGMALPYLHNRRGTEKVVAPVRAWRVQMPKKW